MIITKEEVSLSLFFETCAVDQRGKINTEYMSKEDFKIAKKWNERNFIIFGRIPIAQQAGKYTHYCFLTKEAWKETHEARKTKADRTYFKSELWFPKEF